MSQVWPCESWPFGSAPAASRDRTTSVRPELAATPRGVAPWIVLESNVAPERRSWLTMSVFPPRAAKCSAVTPCESARLGLAWASRSARTDSVLPYSAAYMSAVDRRLSWGSGDAPAASRMRTISAVPRLAAGLEVIAFPQTSSSLAPPPAAAMSGVQPSLSAKFGLAPFESSFRTSVESPRSAATTSLFPMLASAACHAGMTAIARIVIMIPLPRRFMGRPPRPDRECCPAAFQACQEPGTPLRQPHQSLRERAVLVLDAHAESLAPASASPMQTRLHAAIDALRPVSAPIQGSRSRLPEPGQGISKERDPPVQHYVPWRG